MAGKEGNLERRKLPKELVDILNSLALEWGDDLDIDKSLEMNPLAGAGYINQLYRLSWPAAKNSGVRDVLVRIFGKGMELFLDRNEEIRAFEWLSEQGVGPRLYGHLPNGRVEQFIYGRTLLPDEVRNPTLSALIAGNVRFFHSLDKPGPKTVVLWDRLRSWLCNAKTLCSSELLLEFSVNNLEKEIDELKRELSKGSQVIAFCHNDLHYGNMLFNETTQSLTLIDYECSGYNPVAYDIANYFCEMTTDYYSNTPHILDFNKYPGLDERQKFIRMYLTSADYQPTQIEVEQFADDVEKYALTSHLSLGLWGIISVEHANNYGQYDYLEYARQRFRQYWLRKSELSTFLKETSIEVKTEIKETCIDMNSCASSNKEGHLKVKEENLDHEITSTTELLVTL